MVGNNIYLHMSTYYLEWISRLLNMEAEIRQSLMEYHNWKDRADNPGRTIWLESREQNIEEERLIQRENSGDL